MAPGEAQELRLEQYLRSHRRCEEIFRPDQQVRQELHLPKNCKCADILALHSPKAAVTEVTVAESKGTDISTALVQLGNAAAGALECFRLQGQFYSCHPNRCYLRVSAFSAAIT
jgi:hypothetical protein